MSLLDKAVIIPIEPQQVCNYSEIAIPFIKLALEQTEGETSLDSILSDIANHKRQLWIVKDHDKYIAAVVTMIYTTETGIKIGEITMAGGQDHAKWNHFIPSVEKWFKEMGCDIVQIIGRAGWERLYKESGFIKKYTILRRKIANE